MKIIRKEMQVISCFMISLVRMVNGQDNRIMVMSGSPMPEEIFTPI
jgi:hypothetical protein